VAHNDHFDVMLVAPRQRDALLDLDRAVQAYHAHLEAVAADDVLALSEMETVTLSPPHRASSSRPRRPSSRPGSRIRRPAAPGCARS
jgi:hypothetical protein